MGEYAIRRLSHDQSVLLLLRNKDSYIESNYFKIILVYKTMVPILNTDRDARVLRTANYTLIILLLGS